MKERTTETPKPEILAPAGNKASFLAAVAARADAIYCGLKLFSARMEAKNFTLEEFTALVRLAHKKGIKVFVALNSLLKPTDLAEAGKMLDQLQRQVKPDAIIIQDLALVPLVLAGDRPGNEIQSPMGLVIIGGLLTSTFLNLIVVPVLYEKWGRSMGHPTRDSILEARG